MDGVADDGNASPFKTAPYTDAQSPVCRYDLAIRPKACIAGVNMQLIARLMNYT